MPGIRVENSATEKSICSKLNINTNLSFLEVPKITEVGMAVTGAKLLGILFIDLENITVTFCWTGNLKLTVKEGTTVVDDYQEVSKLKLVFIQISPGKYTMSVSNKTGSIKVYDDVLKYNISFVE